MSARIGRYDLCGKLAEGGMAAIYFGRLRGAEGFERPMAIKMIKPALAKDATFVNMFIDEARLVAKLSHPNVVQIYDLGDDDKRLFLAMELLLGQSLADVWAECRARGVRLRGDVVAWMGARIAEGLHHAHDLENADGTAQHLVHRDVNPSNIFITYDGQIKLIDFGLVKAVNRLSSTEFGIVKGKLAYLSPEQTTAKPVDRRSDIFSLATTLWELSADRRLFKSDNDGETVRVIREANVPDPTAFVPEYPSLLWLVLRRALAREPDDRYATAGELARDLDGVARAQGSILQAATLAEIMRELFAPERERETAWFKEAMATTAPENLPALRPPDMARSAAQATWGARGANLPYLALVPRAVSELAPAARPEEPLARSPSTVLLRTAALALGAVVLLFGAVVAALLATR